MLLQTPAYRGLEQLPLFVPGELLHTPLQFPTPVVAYVSANNPGARAFAAELELVYTGIKIEEQPGSLRSGEEPLGANAAEATHFLLYLNTETYVGSAGKQLVEELRTAMRAAQPGDRKGDATGSVALQESSRKADRPVKIVMVHENDPDRGGCEFARFFHTTPHDLISDGLYQAIALAAYPGKTHRAASMAQLAKALGAVTRSSSMAQRAVVGAVRSGSSTLQHSPQLVPHASLRRVVKAVPRSRPMGPVKASACAVSSV
jgi:hypothetical protein